MMKKFKQYLKSKTMVFGALVVIAGGVEQSLGFLEKFMTPGLYGVLTSAIGISIVWLRLVTTTSVDSK